MVEYLTNDPEIESSNPAATRHQEKMAGNKDSMPAPGLGQDYQNYIKSCNRFFKSIISVGSIVVEHTTTDPEIEGSNPAATRYQEKMVGNKDSMPVPGLGHDNQNYIKYCNRFFKSIVSVGRIVVEYFTIDPEMEGLNLAATRHQEKMAGNKDYKPAPGLGQDNQNYIKSSSLFPINL